ncbi:MAG: acetyl-CoA hydrolase/transferase family protein [Christensenellales bacterium]|jgi:4-hydroxybutyrate CoA-transferase
MSWKNYYDSRKMSAREAVALIKNGDRVAVGHAIAEPSHIINTMVENRDEFRDIELVHMVLMGEGQYCSPGMEQYFRHNSLFVGGAARKAVADGRADYTPCYFSEIPSLFTDGHLPTDVAVISVSPPDKAGFCSLGVAVDYTITAARNAKTVIAQVNKNMPRTLGDSFLHVNEIHAFVERDESLIELHPCELTEVEMKIGENCAALVKDGDTLQLGIGSLPDAVLHSLKDKNDLGVHSEMISDGVVDLVNAGVINGRRKTLHKGKIVVTFLMGTRKLYDFVDDNPMIYMAPVEYTNDPYIIRQNDGMISINSCVQVDLLGQVCSESVGLRQISAVGGQVDFVRGANMSRGGKSIIAMPSTAAGGKISKIVPVLDEGAAVTTNRNDVSYIVTEYGAVQLKGKTLRERARLLISIAHPDFRPALQEEYEKRFRESF